MSDVFDLPLDVLEVDAANPRTAAGPVEELAASIASEGLLAPLLVRPLADGRFGVLNGQRRLAALQLLGVFTARCMVRATDDADARLVAVADNVAREDLNPVEEARAYRRLLDETGLTQQQLARRVGVSPPRVTQRLKLLDLPADILALVADGTMSVGAAYRLAKKTRGALDRARTRPHQITTDDVDLYEPLVVSSGLAVQASKLAERRREPLTDLVARAVRRELATPSCQKCETRPALTGIGRGVLCGTCKNGGGASLSASPSPDPLTIGALMTPWLILTVCAVLYAVAWVGWDRADRRRERLRLKLTDGQLARMKVYLDDAEVELLADAGRRGAAAGTRIRQALATANLSGSDPVPWRSYISQRFDLVEPLVVCEACRRLLTEGEALIDETGRELCDDCYAAQEAG